MNIKCFRIYLREFPFRLCRQRKKMGTGRELGLSYASDWQCLSESPGARLAAHLYPSEVPRAADWDKLPRLKGWNTTSKHRVDQRWKQQAFPSGSSFRPSSLFGFHFGSDNAAERSLSCASVPRGTAGMERGFPCQQPLWGLGLAGLSSQASLMGKIYHFQQGREDWWSQSSRAELSCPRCTVGRRSAESSSTVKHQNSSAARALPGNQPCHSRYI